MANPKDEIFRNQTAPMFPQSLIMAAVSCDSRKWTQKLRWSNIRKNKTVSAYYYLSNLEKIATLHSFLLETLVPHCPNFILHESNKKWKNLF